MSHQAAIYLRVSKSDGSQSVENQRPEVEQLAKARGFEVVTTYEETMSAAKHRPTHDQMMKDARRGKFNVLLVWSLDRFGRESRIRDAVPGAQSFAASATASAGSRRHPNTQRKDAEP